MSRLVPPTDLAPHPDRDLVPDLTPEEREGLRESIGEHGILHPIIVSDPNRIVDGHHRWELAQEVGLEEVPVERRPLSDEEERDLLIELNLSRRQLTRDQKIELATTLRRKEWTQQRIARVLGVGQSTVDRWLRDVTQTGNTDLPDTITDAKGRQQPATKSRTPSVPEPEPEPDPDPEPMDPGKSLREAREASAPSVEDDPWFAEEKQPASRAPSPAEKEVVEDREARAKRANAYQQAAAVVYFARGIRGEKNLRDLARTVARHPDELWQDRRETPDSIAESCAEALEWLPQFIEALEQEREEAHEPA